ncbi:MAG: hypothetical protein WBM25_05435, partial [Azonexus sp.]
ATALGQNPKQLSLPFALWNRRAVMQLIPPSSTVRGQKQCFSEGTPRNHAGFRRFFVNVV